MSDVERRYHENGKLRFECPLKEGLRHGEGREFYESGALRGTYFYQDGLLEGPHELLHENGQRLCRHVYRKGRVIDSFVPILNPDGSIYYTEYWENGRCRGYDKNNRLRREFGMFNTSHDGIYRTFFGDGRVASEMFYNAGTLDGFAKYWSEDGLKCNVYLYVDGEECVSKKMEYHENGMQSREIDMNGDLPDGMELTYHENGTLRTRMFYEKGMAKDGPVNYYDEDGVPTVFTHWENNVAKSYTEEGKLVLKAYYYRDMQNGLCISYVDSEEVSYYFDDVECESKEDFLEKTFVHLSEKLERSLSDNVGFEANTFKEFFEEQYKKIMTQSNAGQEFFNYEELIRCPENTGREEWIVRLAVREFMLRLRLPNDGDTEERVVNGLKKLLGVS